MGLSQIRAVHEIPEASFPHCSPGRRAAGGPPGLARSPGRTLGDLGNPPSPRREVESPREQGGWPGPQDSLCPQERVGLSAGCETRASEGTLDPSPQKPTALWGAAALQPPVCPPTDGQPWEGYGDRTLGIWMPAGPCPQGLRTCSCRQASHTGPSEPRPVPGARAAGAPKPRSRWPRSRGAGRQVEPARPGLSWSVLCQAGVRPGWGRAFLLCAWPGSPCRQEARPKLSPRSLLLPWRPVPETSRDRAPCVGGSLRSPSLQGPHQSIHVQGHLSPANPSREGRQVPGSAPSPVPPAAPERQVASGPPCTQAGRGRSCAVCNLACRESPGSARLVSGCPPSPSSAPQVSSPHTYPSPTLRTLWSLHRVRRRRCQAPCKLGVKCAQTCIRAHPTGPPGLHPLRPWGPQAHSEGAGGGLSGRKACILKPSKTKPPCSSQAGGVGPAGDPGRAWCTARPGRLGQASRAVSTVPSVGLPARAAGSGTTGTDAHL